MATPAAPEQDDDDDDDDEYARSSKMVEYSLLKLMKTSAGLDQLGCEFQCSHQWFGREACVRTCKHTFPTIPEAEFDVRTGSECVTHLCVCVSVVRGR